MMRLLVITALVAAATAAPQAGKSIPSKAEKEVQLIRFESDNNGLGSYRYSFEQDDGSKREEQGELKNAGTDEESIVMKGSYSWIGPDGVTYVVTYIADENGFQPTIEQGGGGIPPAVVAALIRQV